MSHKARWRRWLAPLLSALLLASVAVVPARAAYQATIDSNVSAFQPPCVGYFDSLPTRMLNAAKAAYTTLGYSASAFSGASFTRAHTLSRTVNDWGYYVHSHGDYYWHSGDQRRYSGFREDGGDCTQAVVYSKDIATKRAGRESNLVVISTCFNGDAITTLPAAFGIEKVKATGDSWNGPEFFLAYHGESFDNDEWTFEQRFWNAIANHARVGEAFDIASLGAFTHADFEAEWWGSYNAFGIAGPYKPVCPACQ